MEILFCGAADNNSRLMQVTVYLQLNTDIKIAGIDIFPYGWEGGLLIAYYLVLLTG